MYFRDTRLVSAWSIYADGVPWRLLNGGAISYYAARIFLTNDDFITQQGLVAARTLSLVIGRAVDGGLHEDLDLTNYGLNPDRFSLEIASRSDFADIFEAKANKIVRRGQIETLWDAQRGALSNTYCNKDFFRSVTITACGGVPVYANGRMSFQIDLAPGVSWHCCLHYDLADGQDSVPAPVDSVEKGAEGRQADSLDQWRKQVLSIPPRTRSTTVFSTKRWKTWQLCGFHARATVPGSPCRRQGCLGSWRLSDATA